MKHSCLRVRGAAGVVCALAACMMSGGCAEPYKNIVRPVPKMSLLSPELENLSDFKVETYLTADARPVFPTTLAVAKMGSSERRYYRSAEDRKNDPVETAASRRRAGEACPAICGRAARGFWSRSSWSVRWLRRRR